MKKYIKSSEDWRLQNPLFQEKTLGGVYFYSSPNLLYGDSIEKDIYKRLPKYAQKSVLQLHSTGVSTSGWFKIANGVVYMNHLNSDFLWAIRDYGKDKFENANGWNVGDPENYVTDTYCT